MGLLNLREKMTGEGSSEPSGQTPLSFRPERNVSIGGEQQQQQQQQQQGGDSEDLKVKMLTNISEVIFQDNPEQIVQFLQDQNAPVERNIGVLAQNLVKTQANVVASVKGQLPEDIMMEVGGETIEMLTEVAQAAGIHNPQSAEEEMQFVSEAGMQGMQAHMNEGVDPQMQQQMGQQLQSGELDSMFQEAMHGQ